MFEAQLRRGLLTWEFIPHFSCGILGRLCSTIGGDALIRLVVCISLALSVRLRVWCVFGLHELYCMRVVCISLGLSIRLRVCVWACVQMLQLVFEI